MFFPLVAAILQATSFTLDKVILLYRKVDFKSYISVSFPLIFLINSIIFLIVKPEFFSALIFGKLFWWLIASVALTIISNLIYYKALENDKLSEIETIGLLSALPVVIVSGILFSDERNFAIITLAILSSLAIVWSHWKGHKFLIKKDTLPFLVWSLTLAPISALVSKILLAEWSPISLEMVRMGVVAALLAPFFKHKIKRIPLHALWFLLMTNVLTSIAWILFYFSYQKSGIVYTMLLFSIQPLLVYLGALLFLHEKLELKKLIAFIIVLISIGIAQFLA